MPDRDFVLGLGTNLGNRTLNLVQAVQAVAPLGILLKASGLFETPPVGPPQPDYLNAALLFRSGLGPGVLMEGLLGVEVALGRVRNERWGPRVIDLDLLWSPGLVLSESNLVLPHPALCERPFALQPLLEVAPDASDPLSGRTYRDILGSLGAAPLYPLAGTEFGAWIR